MEPLEFRGVKGSVVLVAEFISPKKCTLLVL